MANLTGYAVAEIQFWAFYEQSMESIFNKVR